MVFITLIGVVLLASLGGSVVDAKGPITGVGFTQLTCNLPSFPSGVKNTTVCSGTCVFLPTAAMFGSQGTSSVFFGAGACATKKVSYTQPCATLGTTGTATGSLQGTGTLLPSGHAANIWIPFFWQRWGAIAFVTTGKLSNKGNKTIVDKVTGEVYQDTVGDLAIGTFTPLGFPDIVNCPGGPLAVLITALDLEIA
jgi:hypothetical protein